MKKADRERVEKIREGLRFFSKEGTTAFLINLIDKQDKVVDATKEYFKAHSFCVVTLPRKAGKSTYLKAYQDLLDALKELEGG